MFIKFCPNHLFLCVVLSVLVSGCGFHPVYEPFSESDVASKPQVFVLNIQSDNPNGYTAYKLRRELEQWLPRIAQKVPHPLTVTISFKETYGDIALNAQVLVLRSQGQLRASIRVTDSSLQGERLSISALTQNLNSNTAQPKTVDQNDAIHSVSKQEPTELLNTTLDVVTSYTVPNTEEFVIISAEAGARERLIKQLAKNIAQELQMLSSYNL